ncbi:hypothetical protein BH24BAC1_BH24BAC1_32830 [soil metagenome]
MKTKVTALFFTLSLMVFSGCKEFLDHLDKVEPDKTQVKEFASGLAAPLGMAIDAKGQIWVTEIGTGQNDGKVSVIRPNGSSYVVIEGFPSFMGPGGPEEIVGLNHLVMKEGTLYILHANGTLYITNVASFTPGETPLQASALLKEDIGSFVLSYAFEEDAEESNPYNLTFGPGGNLYIADAAANALIRRTPAGVLSVFATFPDIVNPAPFGPPTLDAVPTSIAFDGQKFYVTTLTGFPFPAGKARLYTLDGSGNITDFQEGFTTLTDMTLRANHKPVVIEHAQFTPQGFAPNSGRMILVSDNGKQEVLVQGLNFPTAIVSGGPGTYYVNSLADGKIMKVTTR